VRSIKRVHLKENDILSAFNDNAGQFFKNQYTRVTPIRIDIAAQFVIIIEFAIGT